MHEKRDHVLVGITAEGARVEKAMNGSVNTILMLHIVQGCKSFCTNLLELAVIWCVSFEGVLWTSIHGDLSSL